MDKIMRHPLMQDLVLETIIDYSIDFMRIVGVPTIFENKVEQIEINNYRAKLPCDFYEVTQARLIDKACKVLGVFRHTSDSFHLSEIQSEQSNYTYKIQGDIIYTSVKNGIIEMSYQAIAQDDEGYPLIPDNSSFTRALEAYVKKQYFTILFDMGQISHQVLHNTQSEYAWAVGDAQTEFNRLTIDEAETFFNSWKTMLTRSSEHKQGFLHSGTQEKLKVK